MIKRNAELTAFLFLLSDFEISFGHSFLKILNIVEDFVFALLGLAEVVAQLLLEGRGLLPLLLELLRQLADLFLQENIGLRLNGQLLSQLDRKFVLYVATRLSREVLVARRGVKPGTCAPLCHFRIRVGRERFV